MYKISPSPQIIPPPPQSPWCTSSLPHHTTPQPKLGGNIIRDSRLWAWWVRAVKETAWCLRGPWDPTVLLSKVGGKISLRCFGMAVVSVSLFGLICVLMYTCVGGWVGGCEHLNVWRIVFQVFQVWRWLPVSKFWDGLRWKPCLLQKPLISR